MHPPLITSPKNPLLLEYKKLSAARKHRFSAGKLALEGPNLVRSALAAGYRPETVICSETYYHAEIAGWLAALPDFARLCLVPDALFSQISFTETPQAVAAIVAFEYKEAELNSPAPAPGLSLILDRIRDPGNMGTIIRTAVSVAVEAIYCLPGCVDPYSPKALRSSAGAIFDSGLVYAGDPANLLQQLKKSSVQVIDSRPDAKTAYWDCEYSRPTAFIIGNESSGTSEEISSSADISVSIPQKGLSGSLNAAVAASLLLYEAYRQRRN